MMIVCFLIIGQGFVDGFRIKNGNGCAAVGAGILRADVNRGATPCAMNCANACCKGFDFSRSELSDKPFFDHELGKNSKSAMVLQTAVIGEPPALCNIHTGHERVFAARTMQRSSLWPTQVAAVVVNDLEEFNDTGWSELLAFKRVKPDALAGKTQIKCDFAEGPSR